MTAVTAIQSTARPSKIRNRVLWTLQIVLGLSCSSSSPPAARSSSSRRL